MADMSQVEFARYIGRDKSYVTRLKQAGRLVLTEEGRVDAEASIARIKATQAQRFDVMERFHPGNPIDHPATQTPATAAPAPTTADPLDVDEIGRRTRYAQMLKEEALARTKQREDELAAGAVIERAQVKADMALAVGNLLNAFAGRPDRLAPLLVNQNDQAVIRALLRDEDETLMATVAAELAAIAQGREAA